MTVQVALVSPLLRLGPQTRDTLFELWIYFFGQGGAGGLRLCLERRRRAWEGVHQVHRHLVSLALVSSRLTPVVPRFQFFAAAVAVSPFLFTPLFSPSCTRVFRDDPPTTNDHPDPPPSSPPYLDLFLYRTVPFRSVASVASASTGFWTPLSCSRRSRPSSRRLSPMPRHS